MKTSSPSDSHELHFLFFSHVFLKFYLYSNPFFIPFSNFLITVEKYLFKIWKTFCKILFWILLYLLEQTKFDIYITLISIKNNKIDVEYLSSGFEYFLSGFAQELVPIRPTLVPGRTRRALSIPLFTFPNRPSLPSENTKYRKNRQNLSISCPDSLVSWFQLDQHWFQVELDELYRFYYSLLLTYPTLPP